MDNYKLNFFTLSLLIDRAEQICLLSQQEKLSRIYFGNINVIMDDFKSKSIVITVPQLLRTLNQIVFDPCSSHCMIVVYYLHDYENKS